MRLTEVKGDVKFYQNEAGELFQQLFDGEIEPVVDGEDEFRDIEREGVYLISYELNGRAGFTVWSTFSTCSTKGIMLQGGFWSLQEARNYILKELPRECAGCSKEVYLEKSPEFEVCSMCDQVFCSDCIDWKQSSEAGAVCRCCTNPDIASVGDGVVLMHQTCETCHQPLRYTEWVDGYTKCEDCQR